jgi:hypothetical protein
VCVCVHFFVWGDGALLHVEVLKMLRLSRTMWTRMLLMMGKISMVA